MLIPDLNSFCLRRLYINNSGRWPSLLSCLINQAFISDRVIKNFCPVEVPDLVDAAWISDYGGSISDVWFLVNTKGSGFPASPLASCFALSSFLLRSVELPPSLLRATSDTSQDKSQDKTQDKSQDKSQDTSQDTSQDKPIFAFQLRSSLKLCPDEMSRCTGSNPFGSNFIV